MHFLDRLPRSRRVNSHGNWWLVDRSVADLKLHGVNVRLSIKADYAGKRADIHFAAKVKVHHVAHPHAIMSCVRAAAVNPIVQRADETVPDVATAGDILVIYPDIRLSKAIP